MHRRPFLTALRGFLLSLFVLGGPGLPLIDALVWHGSGTEQVAGSRLDRSGAARTHADSCSLAAPVPVPGPMPCATSPVPIFRTIERAAVAAGQSVRLGSTPDRNTRPRAPPVFSA